MPKITAINQQVKKQDRYSIFVDGKYALSLSSAQLIDCGIASGDELDSREIAKLVDLSGYGKMMDRAYNYLSFRPRSKKEVSDYLTKKGCDEPTTQKIINALADQNLINDASFAETWVSERREFQLRSRRQLEHELRQKGIEKDVIDSTIDGFQGEVETIKNLVTKKSLAQKYATRERLIAYLSSKGFRFSDIRAALEQLEQKS